MISFFSITGWGIDFDYCDVEWFVLERNKDLNIRPETIKLLEENIGKTLSDTNHSKIVYDPPPRILEIKAKINKPRSLMSPALSGRFLTTEPPRRPVIPATTGCLCPGQKIHAASPCCPLVSQRPELAPRVRSARCAHRAAYVSWIRFRKCAYMSTFIKFLKIRSRCWIFSNFFSNSLDVHFFFFFLGYSHGELLWFKHVKYT